MSYGLSEEVLAKITSTFAQYPEIGLAILYGSREQGELEITSVINTYLERDAQKKIGYFPS